MSKILDFIIKIYNFLFKKNRWDILIKLINDNKIENYAEIGVFKGENVEKILKACPTLKKVYCIDSYIYMNWDKYNTTNYEVKEKAIKKLKSYSKVEWLFLDSIEASKKFKSNSLDMIFIDAEHTYKALKKDLIAWYPKVKKNGLITGHDYRLGRLGVCLAVQEFFNDNYEVNPNIWINKKTFEECENK